MTRLAILFAMLATPAFAHVGHVGEVAGHGHWIAVGALGAAALAAWLAAKSRGKKAQSKPDAEEERDEAEA